jgi:hypothetical protein
MVPMSAQELPGDAPTFARAAVRPGALDLLEAGVLRDDAPRFDDLPTAGVVRAGAGSSTDLDTRSRWQAFLDRLRGYRRERRLFDRTPVWVPIVTLVPPPAGAASIALKCETSSEESISLKILGVGFGNAIAATFAREIAFETSHAPVALSTQVLLTATRYVHDTAPPFTRVDVELGDAKTRLAAAPAPRPPVALVPPRYEVLERLELAGAGGAGTFTWKRRVGGQTSWELSLAPSLPSALQTELSLGVQLSSADESEVTLELPYGANYVLYHEAGTPRLAPQCLVTRAT